MRAAPLLSFCLLFLVAAVLPAIAGPRTSRPEFRAGAMIHDPGSPERGGVDVNAELMTARLFATRPSLKALVPRAHIGGTLNATGGTGHAYAGFTWTHDFGPRLFVEGALGLALHNGRNGRTDAGRAPLGCSWGFRESISLGRRLTDRLSVMATVEHLSNAGLCDENRGLTYFGLRVSRTF